MTLTRHEHPVDDPAWSPQTRLVRTGQDRSAHEETAEALYLTSGYVYASAEAAEAAFRDDGSRYVYSRYANPTISTFERRLAAYEGAALCVGTGSGMAAVFASMMALLRAGDRVVASRALFGSCHVIVNEFLPRWGVETELVDGPDLAAWGRALARPATLVFVETPSNPCLDLVDLRAVADLAHAAGARLIVDNIFASPVCQRPFAFGADLVVYSATKHMDGQGRTLGGAILANDPELFRQILPFLRHTGPALSPFNAWVLAKGLETLELRVRAMQAGAERIASVLAERPEVTRLRYPGHPSHPQHELCRRQMRGGGTLLAFDVAGGKPAAFALLNRLRLISISNNLGDAKSLMTHPETTTHQRVPAEVRAQVGIGPGTLRLSVGLEDPADLIADLERGFG